MSMSGKEILIIEDDKYQADELSRRLKDLGAEVRHIATESEFRDHLEHAPNYAVAVVDMMLRWTDPSRTMRMPPREILEEGFYTAGLRCCRALMKRGTQCVIFTALDPQKIPVRTEERIPIINKSRGYDALVEEIKPLLDRAD